MKTITLTSIDINADTINQAVQCLKNSGIVCLPCAGSYRLLADLTSVEAVNKLLQSKGRTKVSPALVFIADEKMLPMVSDQLETKQKSLMKAFWPGPLTILFNASEELPNKVRKQLTKFHAGKLGIRIPQSDVALEVVSLLGRPVLVSSANKQKKQGSESAAQVRKNFVGRIDLFLDAGDLKDKQSSTVVDVSTDKVVITRVGSVDEDSIKAVIEQA